MTRRTAIRSEPAPRCRAAGGSYVAVCSFLVTIGLGITGAAPAGVDQAVILPVTDANDVRFTHVTVADTPVSRVHRVLQDQHGFVWFAVQDKLQRYDGYEVRAYPSGRANPDSNTSFTRSMIVGSDGKLWLARDRGLGFVSAPFGSPDHFDPVTEVFKPFLTQDGAFQRPIIDVQQDRNGELWLATNEGLFRMDAGTRRAVRYGHDPNAEGSLSADEIRATLEGRDGAFWVATTKAIDRFDRRTGKVVRRFPLIRGSSERTPVAGAIALCEDAAGDIWIGTARGLTRIDRK